jgi:hypothetical protein
MTWQINAIFVTIELLVRKEHYNYYLLLISQLLHDESLFLISRPLSTGDLEPDILLLCLGASWSTDCIVPQSYRDHVREDRQRKRRA